MLPVRFTLNYCTVWVPANYAASLEHDVLGDNHLYSRWGECVAERFDSRVPVDCPLASPLALVPMPASVDCVIGATVVAAITSVITAVGVCKMKELFLKVQYMVEVSLSGL